MRKTRHNALRREIRQLFVGDVMAILGIGQSKAYQIMRRINKELEAQGYETIAGRIPEARFREKFYCSGERNANSVPRSAHTATAKS